MKRTILASLGLAVAGALAAVGIGVATAAPGPTTTVQTNAAPATLGGVPVAQAYSITVGPGAKTVLDPRVYGDAAGPYRFDGHFDFGWSDIELVSTWTNPAIGVTSSPTGKPWVAFVNSGATPTAPPAWLGTVSTLDATRIQVQTPATGPATMQTTHLDVQYRLKSTGEVVWAAAWEITWRP